MKTLSGLICLLAMLHSAMPEVTGVSECIDVEGAKHREGEAYMGPDKCNTCKCLNGKNACTKRFCSPDLRRESAEARRCVDNLGNLHERGETYTHVDGCNSCQCTENGGACTKMFCLPEQQRTGGMCMDQSGTKKGPGETWMSYDGCNHCICSIFGPMCTKKMCNPAKTLKNGLNSQLCVLTNGTSVAPGATWLTDDSCNVCTCSGETGQVTCTEDSCRYRLNKMKNPQFQYSGAENFFTSWCLLILTSLGLLAL